MGRFDNQRSVNYVGNGYQSVSYKHIETTLFQHVKSKVELTAENEELKRRVGRLEVHIKSIMQNGIHISESTSQRKLQKVAIRLRKEGQGGWLYFIEDGVPELQ